MRPGGVVSSAESEGGVRCAKITFCTQSEKQQAVGIAAADSLVPDEAVPELPACLAGAQRKGLSKKTPEH